MNRSRDLRLPRATTLPSVIAGLALAFDMTLVQAGEVTAYSSAEADTLKVFADAFSKAHPDILVNWVQGSTGVIQARLIAEKDKPVADVVFAHTAANMEALAQGDLLDPYGPPGVERLIGRFVDTRKPPAWIGLYGWASAMCFNTAIAAKDGLPKPATWEDLVQPVFKGKVVMPSPVTSGTGLLMVTGWIQMWGEEKAWAYMDKLNGNVSRYTTSGSRPCELAGAGEAAVGLSLPARGARIKAGGAPIDVIVASDGTGWDIQAAGIVRGSKNQADAKTLVDWAVSMPAMEVFGANAEVTALRVRVRKPEFLPPNITEKLIKIDFKWLAKEQGRIIAEWERRYGAKVEKKG